MVHFDTRAHIEQGVAVNLELAKSPETGVGLVLIADTCPQETRVPARERRVGLRIQARLPLGCERERLSGEILQLAHPIVVAEIALDLALE